MDIDQLLSTTRCVRKRLDLERTVSSKVIEECLELALQAPSASNRQDWHFLILDQPEPKKIVAAAYRKAFKVYARQSADKQSSYSSEDPRALRQSRVSESAMYLAQVLHRVPVLVIPCIEGRAEHEPQYTQAARYGSILPAAWSFMLALRARGLGAAWTTLHLMFENEVSAALGIPESVTQACMLPVAYTRGDHFKPADRLPLARVSSWNRWGQSSPR